MKKPDLNVLPLPPHRLRPPSHLTPAEREVFAALVGAVDQRHFQASDLPLVASYATAVVTEREAVDHLRREGHVVNGRANPWLVVKEKSHREMIALSLRLRLSPQGRDRLKVKENRMSVYDIMELQGDDGDDRSA